MHTRPLATWPNPTGAMLGKVGHFKHGPKEAGWERIAGEAARTVPGRHRRITGVEHVDKVVHVDQNHCWTYAPLQSDTGLTFRPKPKKGSSFASLLGSYGKS